MKQHNKIILLVEDEAPFQEIYRDILESEGYDLVIQDSGEGALEWLEYNTPDLVLLDIILPKISGIEVLTKMRQTTATQNTPIIVYSVIDDQEQIDNAMKLGANDFLIKGQTAAYDVLAKVNELLGAPMMPAEQTNAS